MTTWKEQVRPHRQIHEHLPGEIYVLFTFPENDQIIGPGCEILIFISRRIVQGERAETT